ncbi:MAG: KGG domain-containing protein [Patescibacteria group bacterium]
MAQDDNEMGGRGFAGMSEEKRKQIASKGGKAAHESGKANEFDSETGREAGRKGGQAGRENRGGEM